MNNLCKLIFVITILWISLPISAYLTFMDLAKSGQLGDTFGIVNALFSGLAFAGLIYTIGLQRKELKLQRTELQLQREEMIASRGELANQTKAQDALFRATVAQIAVAAAQAEIEAIKMEHANTSAHLTKEMINRVYSISKSIASLSDHIETGSKKWLTSTSKGTATRYACVSPCCRR